MIIQRLRLRSVMPHGRPAWTGFSRRRPLPTLPRTPLISQPDDPDTTQTRAPARRHPQIRRPRTTPAIRRRPEWAPPAMEQSPRPCGWPSKPRRAPAPVPLTETSGKSRTNCWVSTGFARAECETNPKHGPETRNHTGQTGERRPQKYNSGQHLSRSDAVSHSPAVDFKHGVRQRENPQHPA